MVGVNGETPALKVGAKVLDGQEEGQQLPVERTVFSLRLRQLLGEKRDGVLSSALAEHSTDRHVRGIRREGEGGRRVGVNQHCRPRKTGLGLSKSSILSRVPLQDRLLGGHGSSQSVEWRQHSGNVGHEPMVEVHPAEETLEVHLADGTRNGHDGADLGWQRANAPGVHRVAQESDGGSSEHTLIPVDGQSSGLKPGEKLADMGDVGVQTRRGDEDVVKVDEDKGQLASITSRPPLAGLRLRSSLRPRRRLWSRLQLRPCLRR